jgi:hypothetical protein
MPDGQINWRLPVVIVAIVLAIGGLIVTWRSVTPAWEQRLTMINLARPFDGDLNYQFIEKVQYEYAHAASDEQKVDILLWVVLHHDERAAHESEEAIGMPIDSPLRPKFLQKVKVLLASPEAARLSKYQHKVLSWFVENEKDLDKYAEPK